MILIISFIVFCYCALILAFVLGFDRVEEFYHIDSIKSKNGFSIIIPFRDEEQNLPELLKSLSQLDYPKDKYEIILVNDESKDESLNIIKRFSTSAQNNIKVAPNLRKTNSPKKDAINTAINQAMFSWIITTDADCILPKNWLTIFNAFIEKNEVELIVAPVTYNSSKTFFKEFQLLDFLSLQGATIGGFGIKKPFLCNGANLCYSKSIFKEVNGFEGNDYIASGDDIFLLEKVLKKYPKKVSYLKSREAIVTTKSQPTFKELIQQRVRWAAKSTGYQNNFNKLVVLSVLSTNALLIILLIMSIGGHSNWNYLLISFSLKFLVDAFLLYKTTSFFNQKKAFAWYLFSSFIYPFFSMFVVITSLSSEYQWKGRQFKR